MIIADTTGDPQQSQKTIQRIESSKVETMLMDQNKMKPKERLVFLTRMNPALLTKTTTLEDVLIESKSMDVLPEKSMVMQKQSSQTSKLLFNSNAKLPLRKAA
jgi:hypothetical protein